MLKKGVQKVMVVGRTTEADVPQRLKQEQGMHVNLHWPEGHKGMDFSNLSLGKTVMVTLRGKIKGMDMHEYGSSINLKVPFTEVAFKQRGIKGDLRQLRKNRVLKGG